jgi:hypothetical protein
MSEWPMRGHFRYLRFKTFPTTLRAPQCEVFFPLLSSSEHSGVPEDSNSQLFQVLGFTPTLGQSGVATLNLEDLRPLAPRADHLGTHLRPAHASHLLRYSSPERSRQHVSPSRRMVKYTTHAQSGRRMVSLVGGNLRKGAPMQHQNRAGKKEGERGQSQKPLTKNQTSGDSVAKRP